MKAPKEYRKIINRIRSRHAKSLRLKGKRRNGSLGWIDDPWLERLLYNSKRASHARNRSPRAQTQAPIMDAHSCPD